MLSSLYDLVLFLTKIFHFACRIVGNPLICGLKAENNCSAVLPEPLSFPPDALNGIYAYIYIYNYFFSIFICVSSSPPEDTLMTRVCIDGFLVFFLAQSDSGTQRRHLTVVFAASFGAAFTVIIIIGLLVWLRYRHNQQIFFDVNGNISYNSFFNLFCFPMLVSNSLTASRVLVFWEL